MGVWIQLKETLFLHIVTLYVIHTITKVCLWCRHERYFQNLWFWSQTEALHHCSYAHQMV